MKNNIIRSGFLILLSILTINIILSSCKKSDGGSPQITGVYLVDSSARDSSITSVLPGTLIHITGRNLSGLKNVYFNDQNASFNPALNSSTDVVILVPASIPTGADGTNVSNTIKMETSSGVATYTFYINPPAPSITSISNENPLAGAKITLFGTNLSGITKVIFPGNVVVSQLENASDTTISLTVPTLSAIGNVMVEGKFGLDTFYTQFGIVNKPSLGFLANFESNSNFFGWANWGGTLVNSNSSLYTKFSNNTGDFIVINPASPINPNDGAWYSDNRAALINNANWFNDSVLTLPANKYALKFELNISNAIPWTAGALYITANNNFNAIARIAPFETALGNAFTTDGWQTITVPFTSFKKGSGSYNATGNTPVKVSELVTSVNNSVQIMLFNDGSDVVKKFMAGIDNVRIVRIAK